MFFTVFCHEKSAVIKEKSFTELTELQEATYSAITIDLWTNEYQRASYLDDHDIWIDLRLSEHCLLDVCHFGTDRHTSGDAAKAIQTIIFAEYSIVLSKITCRQ